MKTHLTNINILKTSRHHFFKWCSLSGVLLCLLFAQHGYSQQGNSVSPLTFKVSSPPVNDDDNNFEEILVVLNVQRIGSIEIPSIIHKNEVYLSVKDVFDFLKIKNSISPEVDMVQGFFLNPGNTYLIDKQNNRIVYQDKTYELDQLDLLRTEEYLFLKSEYFGQVFGLTCHFDFRSLSVSLQTSVELPAIREMKMEIMRRNISKLKGERKADTILGRTFPLFHIGVADWSVTSSQYTNIATNTRARLAMGGVAAGGELNVSLNYFSEEKFNFRQQYFQWRHVNNDRAALRQVVAGKVFAQSVSSLFAPVIGLQFSNTPTTYRRSYGTYTLSNTTEPEWTVELYVNNVLVDYTKADASGFYTFQVPMVYGNSIVKLRFYGPWGEERTSEKFITVPFNFVPHKQFEYNVTGGVVDNNEKSKYGKATFNYGLGKRITVGGGMEYLSTLRSGKLIPFLNTSLRIASHFLVSGEYNHGVRSKITASYRLPSNMQVDINYTKYEKGQTAIRNNYLEEKKIVLSMPFRGKSMTAFSRFTLHEFTFPNNLAFPKVIQKNTAAELLVSAVVKKVSSNLTTYAVLNSSGNPLVYSNLSFTFRLPSGIRFTPQAQYEYRLAKLSSVRAVFEKNIFNRGFMNVTYENTLVNKNNSTIAIGLRYNFSFAQTFFSVLQNRNALATTQSASGSILFDRKTNYVGVSNQTNVGRGGFIIAPFLDLNCNGKRDREEPKVNGLTLRVSGGRIEHNKKDSSIRIGGLEAYTNCFIELDKNSFDNVAWQIKKQSLSVIVEPNIFRMIEVPVAVVGEVSGTVYHLQGKSRTGLGRVIVNIFNSDFILIGKTLSEADGYFSFMGLAPGNYTAKIDGEQLNKLGLTSDIQSFSIKSNPDGDMVEGVELILKSSGSN